MIDHKSLVCTDPKRLKSNFSKLGGKGTNLLDLESIGQPVPPWYCLTTDAFELSIHKANLQRRINKLLENFSKEAMSVLKKEATEIRKLIESITLSEDLIEEITEVYKKRFSEKTFFAVRSSARGEDKVQGSFAGLHDSFLFVRGQKNIAEAVKKVWASVLNDRAITYRLAKGMTSGDISIAVIIQEMVHAGVSGVMFTANPNNGNVKEIVISSLYGAGEGVVSSGLLTDDYIVNKENLSITSTIAIKNEKLILDIKANGGLKRVPLPESLSKKPSLTEEQVTQIAKRGLEIERHFGRPQDIEFSLDAEGHIYILQSRPITTIQEYGPAAENHIIWDNSNIIESYSGVTSPMTFSFIKRAYTIVYTCFAEEMGVSHKLIKDNQIIFENMLGLFKGQVYYNLLNWYRLIRLFPGFNYNRQFMESMMGVKQSVELTAELTSAGFIRRYFIELPNLIRLFLKMMWNFLRIRTISEKFEKNFDIYYKLWSAKDLSTMAPHQLMTLYREMEDALLWKWRAPIINDFFVMIFYGTLKKLTMSWCGDIKGSVQNNLFCGEGDIESTKPTKMLLGLAKEIKDDNNLKDLILKHSPDELNDKIEEEQKFEDIRDSVNRYIELYGFRCINELKLEEPTLRHRPSMLFQMLRNYITIEDADVLNTDSLDNKERQIRIEAEKRVNDSLKRYRGFFLRQLIFRWVLKNARLGVKNRENMRFARTKIYGLLRELIIAIGNRLVAENLIDNQDDIFYLTMDEVWDYIKGTAVTTDLRGLIALRRNEFDGYRLETEEEPDDRFETYGMAYHRNVFKNFNTVEAIPETELLKGIGCCPGKVSGKVKVLRNPYEDVSLSGEILVAKRTDPGWVNLYPTVSGILIERGSILSHSAIVAREMGIPTIVGIPNLISNLGTDEWVEMDGALGTVRILSKPPNEDSKE